MGTKRTRVVKVTPAGKTHQVISVEGGSNLYRKEPCSECPWRKDSPIGAFPVEAFKISAHTAYDMSPSTFGCHMQGSKNPSTCAGFILKGSLHNMAVRLALSTGKLDLSEVKSDVELYESYREMAEANGVSPDDPVLEECR